MILVAASHIYTGELIAATEPVSTVHFFITLLVALIMYMRGTSAFAEQLASNPRTFFLSATILSNGLPTLEELHLDGAKVF